MERTKLTPKQRAFVDAYAGNAAEAARLAGYSDPSYGRHLITKTHVLAALRSRGKVASAKRVMTRANRQAFWTRVAEDDSQDMRVRLRASELLAKSEGDFIPRKQDDSVPCIIQLNMGAPPPKEGQEKSVKRRAWSSK